MNAETRGRIADSTLQLWIIIDTKTSSLYAVFFTDINEDDSGAKWVSAHALGGRHLRRWAMCAHDGMIQFARSVGCHSVRFSGKRGWRRLLRDCRVIGERSPGETIYERAV